MIEYNEAEWVTPAKAAEEMSKQAGYQVTVDDIRQMKRTGKIKLLYKLNKRITLYNLQEIRSVTPPKKRHPKPLQGSSEEAA